MQRHKKSFLRNGFLLSIILHIFLLFCITAVILQKPKEQKKPHHYVPSYVYKGGASSFSPHTSKPSPKRLATANENIPLQENLLAAKDKPMLNEKENDVKANLSAHKEKKLKQKTLLNKQKAPQSMLEASFAALKADQMKSLQRAKDTEPILLVGDLTHVADPIIKLIAQSLSAHFRYPDAEGMMGIKGKVIIELVLHPDGYFTHIQLLKSSQNHNLDAAALYAANTAPRVSGANRFLSKPSRFVVGFVFN